MGQYFIARFLSISYNFYLFKQNNYPVCDIKLILDTNIIITATISCTIYLLPLEYTKKFADEKDTKHADQRDSLPSQTFYSYFKMTFEKVKMCFHQLTV